MSDEHKKTEALRELLQKKLASLPPAADGWNVPSPRVWEGLSEELGAGKKAKRTKSWLARLATIIAALLIILLWRECSNRQQLAILKTEKDALNEAYGKLQADCNDKMPGEEKTSATSPDGPRVGQAGDVAPATIATLKKDPPDLRSSTKKKAPKSSATELPQPENPTFKNTFIEKPGSLPIDTSLVLDEEKQITDYKDSSEATPPSLLPLLPMTALPLPKMAPKPNLNLPKNLKSPASSVALVASLYAGISHTGNIIKGAKPSIIRDEKAGPAFRAGLGLEAVLSPRWSLMSGILYNDSHTRTDYRLQVPFTHTNESQHDDGNFDNQYNHSLPSPLGNYPAQLVLTRESTATVGEGELIDLDLSIRQHARFVSLPLLLRYGIGEKRLRAGLQAGVFANHAIAISSESPTLVSYHSAIHERQTTIGSPTLADLQKFTFDYSFGLDLRYQINPRFSLSLSSNHQRAITPILKQDLLKNYLYSTSLGLGILWKIGR